MYENHMYVCNIQFSYKLTLNQPKQTRFTITCSCEVGTQEANLSPSLKNRFQTEKSDDGTRMSNSFEVAIGDCCTTSQKQRLRAKPRVENSSKTSTPRSGYYLSRGWASVSMEPLVHSGSKAKMLYGVMWRPKRSGLPMGWLNRTSKDWHTTHTSLLAATFHFGKSSEILVIIRIHQPLLTGLNRHSDMKTVHHLTLLHDSG